MWKTFLVVLLFPCLALAAKVEVVATDGNHQLLIDGEPFFVKGGGGDGPKDVLAAVGGNAFRTWGTDNLLDQLDEAESLGLKVAVGIWLGHERHGFDYNDKAQVAEQFESANAAIDAFKDHPAVLLWSIGNEMEGFADGDNEKIWAAVEEIAAYAKATDPNHPTMTVVAEIGGERVRAMHELTPSIDIVGINAYGGAPSIAERYREAGGTKPFILTEFGPVGTWEVQKNDWGAVPEPTSSEKAQYYGLAYRNSVLAEKDKLCLGSFAFTWGFKQEATATWFGMFYDDNTKLAAVDVMQELWTGAPPRNRVPQIEPIRAPGNRFIEGQTVTFTVDAFDPGGEPLTAQWKLYAEAEEYRVGGDAEPKPDRFADAVIESNLNSATIRMPDQPGAYRVFAIVRDPAGGGATANMPVFVQDSDTAAKERLAVAPELPLVLYADDIGPMPYVPSGWVGKTDALSVENNDTKYANSGNTAMRVAFMSPGDWAGVVWQNPANDWGDLPGGFDLSDATKLTFFARGETGGEKVDFSFGALREGQAFTDTAAGKVVVELTDEWQQYEIDLTGKDLRRIKTGFAFAIPGQGKPVVFYLDDVRYE
ncbi:MAG: glycoside hydrolase family 2 TIM barrel-domain containing protein [Planctomycetota bacterium]